MMIETLKLLRARAKKIGLKGYSRLNKKELSRRLKKAATNTRRPKSSTSRKKAKRAQKLSVRPVHTRKAKARLPVPPPVAPSPGEIWWEPKASQQYALDTSEEKIEGMKYMLAPLPTAPISVGTSDLDEDIDTLPVFRSSMLCLMPQKPGVFHAYWILDQNWLALGVDFKLRLLHSYGNGFTVWEEQLLPATRGYWYFHLPTGMNDNDLSLQIGFYRNEVFINALRTYGVRTPNILASTRTDPRWLITDEQFYQMYLRSGGFVHGSELGWSGSSSSR